MFSVWNSTTLSANSSVHWDIPERWKTFIVMNVSKTISDDRHWTPSLRHCRRKNWEKCAVCVAEESRRTNREMLRNWCSAQSARRTVSNKGAKPALRSHFFVRQLPVYSQIIMQLIRTEKFVEKLSKYERLHCNESMRAVHVILSTDLLYYTFTILPCGYLETTSHLRPIVRPIYNDLPMQPLWQHSSVVNKNKEKNLTVISKGHVAS